MLTGTRTIGLHETLLTPPALPPPPTRHALLAFVLALAVILQIGTAGWSDIHNGPEGYYAGNAREQLARGLTNPNEPPLLNWLLLGAFKTFGVTAMAARFPIALASIAAVGFTFLIGERLGGFWRGFVAALLHLCSLGTVVWGRFVTPDPLFAALVGAAIYCGVCGYQGQQKRRLWFAGVAICTGLVCLTRGFAGLLYLAAIFLSLSLIFREARLRFRGLLKFPNVLLFLAVVLPWPAWLYATRNSPWQWLLRDSSSGEGVPLARFALQHLVWWFPTLLLVVPGLLFARRKIFRPHEFELADALPLCWIGIGFVPLLFSPARQDHQSVAMWSALALLAAVAWDRMPSRLRIAGLGLTSGFALGVVICAATGALPNLLPGEAWSALKWLVVAIGLVLLVVTAASVYFVLREREILAIVILCLGMVPIGLSLAEGMVRFDEQFSLADAATFLRARLGDNGEVLYEGKPMSGSSLRFYLDRPFASVDEGTALEKLSAPRPVYLIVDKDRAAYWQQRLTERFHIYHQETTCGSHVIVSNQP
ncbi:MAG: ArnT family glycosyltransferase [Chthoniobacterales bacterium]